MTTPEGWREPVPKPKPPTELAMQLPSGTKIRLLFDEDEITDADWRYVVHRLGRLVGALRPASAVLAQQPESQTPVQPEPVVPVCVCGHTLAQHLDQMVCKVEGCSCWTWGGHEI